MSGKLPCHSSAKLADLADRRLFGVDEYGIGAGLAVCLGTLDRLVQSGAYDESLRPGDDHELRIAYPSPAGFDLAAELRYRSQLVRILYEGIRLREDLILQAHSGGTDPLRTCGEAACRIEVAVAGIPVDEDGQAARRLHQAGHDLQDLRP